jgi:hypothetical protein
MPIAASTIAARVISPLRGLSAVARFDRAEAIGGIGVKKRAGERRANGRLKTNVRTIS